MKCIEKIIEEIPASLVDDQEYYLDIVKFLRFIKPFEVDLDKDYKSRKYLDDSNFLVYVSSIIKGIEWQGQDNTYNYNGKLNYDFQCFLGESSDACYVALSVCKFNEPRSFKSYTGFCLLKFESRNEWFYAIEDFERECGSYLETIDGISYIVVPKMLNENLEVVFPDGSEHNVSAYNLETLKLEIKKIRG